MTNNGSWPVGVSSAHHGEKAHSYYQPYNYILKKNTNVLY